MALLVPLKAMFEAQHNARPRPADLSPAQMRKALHEMIDSSFVALSIPRKPLAIERDMSIPVAGGEIVLRLYRANTGEAALPLHIYFHGGGFFLGTLEQSDGVCRGLAADVGCVVISVGYRLAPEHRFPAAVEDGYAALVWAVGHASDLGVDGSLVSLGGSSAGGNLAAVVSQMSRDRRGPPIVAQVLEIPVTDFTSVKTLNFPEEGIQIAAAKGYASIYLRDEADAHNPQASPLLAGTLENLPPALVMCAEYDQLQPEGEAYANRLADAGVATTYRSWPGQFHGSQSFDVLIPQEVGAYQAEVVTFLRQAYGMSLDPLSGKDAAL